MAEEQDKAQVSEEELQEHKLGLLMKLDGFIIPKLLEVT